MRRVRPTMSAVDRLIWLKAIPPWERTPQDDHDIRLLERQVREEESK